MSQTDMPNVPTHIGFILDGNRRWARSHNLPTLEGHRLGYNNLKDVCKAAADRGISFISAFVFSTENWNRSREEVRYLMSLAYTLLTKDVKELNKENIRVVWLGTKDRVSEKLQKAIAAAEESTRDNTRGTLCLCFNYGGQQEIVDAAKHLLEQGTATDDLTPELFKNALYRPEVPPIDLIIRTSGEQRLSNFMLWRAAYAELAFTTKHWPDFNEADLDAALADYSARHRRLGK